MRSLLFGLASMLIGFLCYDAYNSWFTSQHSISVISEVSLTPTAMPFSISPPPKNAIVGEVVALKGEVFWQSRISSDESKLESSSNIQQGEVVKTEDGTLTMLFENACNISLEPDTTTSFIQTLPNNILISQNTGIATYTRLSEVPVTIRAARMLIDLQKDAEVTVVVDDTEVIITTENGEVELGYNDSDFVSQRVMIEEGEEATFDIETKTILF